MAENILEVRNLCKYFDVTRGAFSKKQILKAVDNVSFIVPDGQVGILLGPNGAGKSTFLKILSGQLETTKGDVTITPGQRLSFLQQDHFKYDDYQVLDTVIMGNALFKTGSLAKSLFGAH